MKQLLKYILSQLLEHQKIAETKHSIAIALIGGLSVIVVGFVDSKIVLIKTLAIIALVFCLLSLLSSFIAVSSKLINIKGKTNIKENINYIYFEDIKNFSPSQYLQSIASAYNFPKGYLPDLFELDLAKTIITTAKRTSAKYKLFNVSLLFLFISLMLLLATGFLGGFDGILF